MGIDPWSCTYDVLTRTEIDRYYQRTPTRTTHTTITDDNNNNNN
jgi:hypothetical protein